MVIMTVTLHTIKGHDVWRPGEACLGSVHSCRRGRRARCSRCNIRGPCSSDSGSHEMLRHRSDSNLTKSGINVVEVIDPPSQRLISNTSELGHPIRVRNTAFQLHRLQETVSLIQMRRSLLIRSDSGSQPPKKSSPSTARTISIKKNEVKLAFFVSI